LFALFMCATALSCSSASTATAPVTVTPPIASSTPSFPLHTSSAYIVDSNGARVRLNAFNWYGTDSTDFVVAGLQSQPLASIVATVKALGFNAVRLPWSNQ